MRQTEGKKEKLISHCFCADDYSFLYSQLEQYYVLTGKLWRGFFFLRSNNSHKELEMSKWISLLSMSFVHCFVYCCSSFLVLEFSYIVRQNNLIIEYFIKWNLRWQNSSKINQIPFGRNGVIVCVNKRARFWNIQCNK